MKENNARFLILVVSLALLLAFGMLRENKKIKVNKKQLTKLKKNNYVRNLRK